MHVRWSVSFVGMEFSCAWCSSKSEEFYVLAVWGIVLEYCRDAVSAVSDATQETVAQYH